MNLISAILNFKLLQASVILQPVSFRQRPESSYKSHRLFHSGSGLRWNDVFWIPAFAGMTPIVFFKLRITGLICKTLALICLFSIQAIAASDYTKYGQMYNGSSTEVYDPYEKINRKIFAFNSVLDRFILRPAALGYDKLTNDYIKGRVGNFTENIFVTPLTTANYALQTNFSGTLKGFWRFVINTTLGIGGLFDVAAKFGITTKAQNFGDTLAYYGVGPGPYIVLPIFGGINARDITNPLLTSEAFNPVRRYMHSDFKLAVDIAKTVHDRSRVLPFTDYVTQSSIDQYTTIRSSIYQNREFYVKYPQGFVYPAVKDR